MKDESIDVMSQNFQSTTLLLCRAMDYYVYFVWDKTFKVGDRVALLERNSRPTLLLQLEKMSYF